MLNTDFLARLGADAEIKETKNGKKFLLFRCAVNDPIKDKTYWVTVTDFSDNAETKAQYYKKGTFLHIHGRLTPSAYISQKTNEAVVNLDVVASSIAFVNSGQKRDEEQTQEDEVTCGTLQKPEATKKAATVTVAASSAEDDLPF